MRNIDNADSPEARLTGFADRLSQAIAHSGLNQSEFARKVGISPGFVSELVRGNKKPGAEFLCAVRLVFGISTDWLLTGDGTMAGAGGINMELIRSIRLYVALARAAVLEENSTAKLVASLIRDGRINDVLKQAEIATFVENITPLIDDADLTVELYNGHLETQDPIEQQRNVLAAAMAHFESRKPFNRMAVLSRAIGAAVQINIGTSQRNAGRDYKGG
jgi:transcriptional regulator with XRE-family HTH domain